MKRLRDSRSRKISRKQDESTSPIQSAIPNLEHFDQTNIPFLQRTIGNKATTQLVQSQTGIPKIQRMPTVAAVKRELGEPHAHKKLFGKVVSEQSTDYRAVLEALASYNTFVMATKVSMDSLDTLMGHYNSVEAAINQYIANKTGKKKKTDKKLPYMRKLQAELITERSRAGMIAVRYRGVMGMMLPLWYIPLTSSGANIIKDSEIEGTDKGGTNEVAKVKQGEQQSFYKANQNAIPMIENMDRQGGTYGDIAKNTKHFKGMGTSGVLNSFNVPADAGIFDETEARTYQDGNRGVFERDINMQTSKRDVATSRLNDLLGAGIIAKAELAFRKLEDGTLQQGSLMEKATGKTLSQTNFDVNKNPVEGQQVSFENPGLQRALSRLQLIDALSGQVDRNMSNFYMQFDTSGNVIGITGIDNDMSFGMMRNGFGQVFNFPGISRFVDEDLANRIIDLDPQVVKAAMTGLLSDAEIDALLQRLQKLKTHLNDLKSNDKLLKPNQWNKATAQGMLDEGTNYYARSHRHVTK